MNENMQNNIEEILKNNPLIPVVTVHDLNELDAIYTKLKAKDISCIEITLRTPESWEAIAVFKEKYGAEFNVGAGTIVSVSDIEKCMELKLDFMVSPGLTSKLSQHLIYSEIAFLPGISTPSEIIRGMEMGFAYFKFFPAQQFGGINALKTYAGLFKTVSFCPTGGINASNYRDFLALKNVISVGGSWLVQ